MQAPDLRDEVRATARRFLEDRVPMSYVAAVADAARPERDQPLWESVAALGWTGMGLPEEAGGFGAGADLLCALFEESGRALLPAPFFSSVALAAPALGGHAAAAERLVDGAAAFSLAWLDPGGGSGLTSPGTSCARVRAAGGELLLDGVKRDVPDAAQVDALVVVAAEDAGVGIYLVEVDQEGVAVGATRSVDGTRRGGTVTFTGARAERLAAPGAAGEVLSRLRTRGLAAAAAEALGLGDRVLEMAVAHAAARHQFGKPIGAFQAVSGPLVDSFVELQTARALLDWAVLAIDSSDAGATTAALAAKVAAAGAAVRTCERAVQVAGAIGFTWEYDLHRYLRRALWLEDFEGGAPALRLELAAALVDAEPPDVVELLDDPAAAEFRSRTREWIEANLPSSRRGLELIDSLAGYDERRELWRLEMCRTHNLVAHWPVEHGGRGATDATTAIFREEAIRAQPRVSHGDCGVDLVAPLLMKYGTPAQRERFLRSIRDETQTWTQGFSEPEAGSDLASLRTRAERVEGGWRVNGQKIWATYGPDADWIFLLARTDPDAVRHRGISCLLVDARSPGVEIRPIRDIAGGVEFAEIFLTDVFVPGENLLGEENQGWQVAIMTLAHERVIESYEDIGELGFVMDRLRDALVELGQRAVPAELVAGWRERYAAIWSRYQGVRLVQYRSVLELDAGGTPPPASEMVKIGWSLAAQDAAGLGLELARAAAAVDSPVAGTLEFWEWNYLNARSLTIYAGTTEIIKSVIGERVLGLPRSR